MSQEIVEAIREIEREKGIESGKRCFPLARGRLARRLQEDARRVAPHAAVELDDAGDYRVYAIELSAGPRGAGCSTRPREHAPRSELERIEEETHEKNHTLLNDDDLDVDWSQVPDELMKREDVTPDNFGRIAAQTAKQVILQRIREAEREMMYDEYIDRVSEVVTGIVQQAGDRNNVLDRPRQGRGAPAPPGAGRRRALRAGLAHQGGTSPRSAPAQKARRSSSRRRDPELVKTLFEPRGARRGSPTAFPSTIRVASHASRATARRSRSSRTPRASTRSAPASALAARACGSMVVSELRGEKIDIIPWNQEPARFVAKALSPAARPRGLPRRRAARRRPSSSPTTSSRSRSARSGMNARLAHRLYRLEDRHRQHDTEFAQQEAEQAAFARRRRRRRTRLLQPLLGLVLSNWQALPECGPARLEVLRRPSPPAARAARARQRGTTRSSRSRSPSSRRWPR